MEIYRFRVLKNWYAYALIKDAEDARNYFLQNNFDPATIGEIEKAQEGDIFEFKMNSVAPNYGPQR